MYAINTFILCLALSYSLASPLTSQDSPLCSHYFTEDLPRQSSAWKVFLDSGIFSPVQDSSNHHMRRLRHKLAEVAAIIDFHKDKYVEDVFGDSFRQIEEELGNLHYPEVIPIGSEILSEYTDHVSSESSLLEAYSIFQRLALSLEVVTTDLNHHQHSAHKMWRLSSRTVSNILSNIYTELVMKGVSIPEPLTRDIIPESMRCLPFSSYRDTRDFIILRHLMQAVEFYSHLLQVQ